MKENKFIKNYIYNLNKTLLNVDGTKLIRFKNIILDKINRQKNIYVCGNGGSSSVSNHFLCDYSKNIKHSLKTKKLKPKVISLSANLDLITAIANDTAYENIFSDQLENFAKEGELLILFSCSGNSKNIIKVAKFAKKKKLVIISFTAFKNSNKLKPFSKVHINLNINNYGVAEDAFQSIMHMVSQMIIIENGSKKKIL